MVIAPVGDCRKCRRDEIKIERPPTPGGFSFALLPLVDGLIFYTLREPQKHPHKAVIFSPLSYTPNRRTPRREPQRATERTTKTPPQERKHERQHPPEDRKRPPPTTPGAVKISISPVKILPVKISKFAVKFYSVKISSTTLSRYFSSSSATGVVSPRGLFGVSTTSCLSAYPKLFFIRKMPDTGFILPFCI